MPIGPCAPVPAVEFTERNLDKLKKLFNGERVTDIDGKEKHIGDAITKHYGLVDETIGKKMFSEIVWRGTYKPAINSFDGFSKSDFRRITKEIVKESKRLNNPSLSILERFAYVKRGVMQKWAITSWMNKNLTKSTNYERTQFSHYLSAHTDISKYLRTEILSRTERSKYIPGIKEVKQLENLENSLIRELSNPTSDEQVRRINNTRRKIIEVLESDGGVVLEELRKYLETAPTNFGTKSEPKYYVVNEKGERYSKNIEKAGNLSRQLLNRMGSVLINGLSQHKKVVRRAYLNDVRNSALLSRTGQFVKRYEEKIDDEINAIKNKVKQGDYFPHYLLETFVRVEKILDRAEKEGYKNPEKDLPELSEIFSNMRDKLGQPMSAQFRSGIPFENYMKNPLSVLRKYSLDAIAFNKTNHVRNVYMEGIQHIPKDSRVHEALRKYLDDMFTLADRGYTDRKPWINKTVRVLTGYEFLSKIGFGLATAARNSLSGLYYVQSVGNRSFYNYLRRWNSEDNKSLRGVIRNVEEEQGFKFEDMSSPLFTEGLLPTEGVRVRDVDIRPDSDGNMTLQFREGKAWKSFDAGLTYAAGKGAIFQKVTENFLRKHMFRYSFMTKYNELVDGGLTEPRAKKLSADYALDMVNKYAFEYAAHQKAPLTGGTTKPIGPIGQVAFQFMHYPGSFLQLQSEILRKSKDAALARQWDSPDLYIPLRFAGLYLFTHMMSGLGNVDLHRLMENDTVDRLQDLYDVLSGKEDVKGRGYMGPAVGDLFFLATMYDFIRLPDNELKNLIVGYNDAYSLTDEQKGQRLLSTINVQMSKILTKDYKALQDNGTIWNALMNDFGLYPKAWTRKLRKKFPLKYIFPGEGTKKKKEKPKTALQLQKEMSDKRSKELSKLYRSMGI